MRPDGLSRDFPISAKFPSMANFKNRLTATQDPNRVAPSQKSHPSRPVAPSRRGSVAPSLPTRVAPAYPARRSCLPFLFSAVAPSLGGSVAPSLPTLFILAYPALGSHHPPVPTFFSPSPPTSVVLAYPVLMQSLAAAYAPYRVHGPSSFTAYTTLHPHMQSTTCITY